MPVPLPDAEPAGATICCPTPDSALRKDAANCGSLPSTCIPRENPPNVCNDAVESTTFIPEAFKVAIICLASTAASASMAYETTVAERPRNGAQSTAMDCSCCRFSRLGAIWASSFRRSIFSASAALVASAALSVALAASAVAPATCACARVEDSFALAMSSRKPSALVFASAACCSATPILASALAARSLYCEFRFSGS